MITGKRRAPSPYAYAKPSAPSKSESYTRLSGNTFLSPESIVSARPSSKPDDSKRPSSARPRSKQNSKNDSDDSNDTEKRRRHHSRRGSKNDSDDSTDTEKRRRHHSRRRSTRETFPKAQYSSDAPQKSDSMRRNSRHIMPILPQSQVNTQGWFLMLKLPAGLRPTIVE